MGLYSITVKMKAKTWENLASLLKKTPISSIQSISSFQHSKIVLELESGSSTIAIPRSVAFMRQKWTHVHEVCARSKF